MHVAGSKHGGKTRLMMMQLPWGTELALFSSLIGLECGTIFLSKSQSVSRGGRQHLMRNLFVTIKKETSFDLEKLHFHLC